MGYTKKQKKIFERGMQIGMIRGLALAIAEMTSSQQEKDIISSSGLTRKECIDANVNEFDMERINPLFDEIEFAEQEEARMKAEQEYEKR